MSSLLAHPKQTLAEHLTGVAKRAQELAAAFHGKADANLSGLLHDLGKADESFQKRLTSNSKNDEKKPHAPQGAALALSHQLWPVAFAVNGHHAGLHNRSDLQGVKERYLPNAQKCFTALCQDKEGSQLDWPDLAETAKLPAWLEKLPFNNAHERETKMRAVEFYTRMLFSALIDADRLDTELANPASGAQTNAQKRNDWRFGETDLATDNAIASLQEELETGIAERVKNAKDKKASQEIIDIRAEVLASCKEKAANHRGIFTLTVPTGGAKTLASINFALSHIAYHNKNLKEGGLPLRRIIIVIPYMNIIQQTTRELKKIFGDLVWNENKGTWVENEDADHKPLILEHHSQATDPEIKIKDTDKDGDGWNQEQTLRQLAVENWDAPIIVTTSVQFFDSLFSRRPADARKLHNICQSVLIFDEVQTLPPLLLQPILDALKELTCRTRPYGCSLLLCTATQPALSNKSGFEFGFEENEITHIILPEKTSEHFSKLKRVEYQGLEKENPPRKIGYEELAEEMLSEPQKQVLAILNTRKQARRLFGEVKAKLANTDLSTAVFHLSTWMYPAHRLQVLAEVERRLSAGEPCFLVSTQCIEAGVDVDFPEVWRALGPYDSIVQAAGRCNRNGALKDADGNPRKGIVHVFIPEEDNTSLAGVYESAIKNTELLRRMGKAFPEDTESFEIYFRLLYQTTVPDAGNCIIQSAREKLHFKEVDELFNFIDADTVPLVIETAKIKNEDGTETTVGDWLKEAKKKTFLTKEEWRKIQSFIINLAYPTSEKTRTFLDRTNSELLFKNDDSIRGLRRMKLTGIYEDDLNGSGLDTTCAAFESITNYIV